MEFSSILIQTIENFKLLSYFIIFLISLTESIAFIGFTIPGTIIIVTSGFLAQIGALRLEGVFLVIFFGVFLGEWISYYLGKKGIRFFKEENKYLHPRFLKWGTEFFKKYGDNSIIFGRFFGLLRPVLPFLAGLHRMNQDKFIFFTILSVFFWVIIYIAIGYFFGNVMDEFRKITNEANLIVTIIISTLLIFYIVKKLIYDKKNNNHH